MTDSPATTDADNVDQAPDALTTYAAGIAERYDADGFTVEFDTIRVFVDRTKWVETIVAARDELPFFSWLSAIDWSATTEVGEGVDDPETLEERFEVICRLSSVENADAVNFIATVPKDDAVIDSLAPHIGGAAWHEREAHEMFGIDFAGNDNLIPLYLPDDFIGNPLLKSYPLIAREVKPWPGDVDVEAMPAKERADDGGDA